MRSSASTLLVLPSWAVPGPRASAQSGTRCGPSARLRLTSGSTCSATSECPACKSLHEQTLKRVKEEYALKGKMRLVHHDFPLPQHKQARQAAILAAAADRLGKFDLVADALFRQQESWSKSGSVDAVVDSVLTPEERKKLREIAKDPPSSPTSSATSSSASA